MDIDALQREIGSGTVFDDVEDDDFADDPYAVDEDDEERSTPRR